MRAVWLLAVLSGCCEGGVYLYVGANIHVVVPASNAMPNYAFEVEAEGEILRLAFGQTRHGFTCLSPHASGYCRDNGEVLGIDVYTGGDTETFAFNLNVQYLHVRTGPERLTLHVDRDAERLLDEDVRPEYTEQGDGCGHREFADVTFTLVD